MPDLDLQNPEESDEASGLRVSDHQVEEDAVDEFVEGLPPAAKKLLPYLAASMEYQGPPHQLLEQIKPEHIDKLLDLPDKQNERVFKDRNANRYFSIAALILSFAFVLILTYLLPDGELGLIKDIIQYTLVGAAGFVGGMGYSKSVSKEE